MKAQPALDEAYLRQRAGRGAGESGARREEGQWRAGRH
jgi:hypothetical protein